MNRQKFNLSLFKVMAMFQSTFLLSLLGYERFHAIDRKSDNRFVMTESKIYLIKRGRQKDLWIKRLKHVFYRINRMNHIINRIFRRSKYLTKNVMVVLGSLFLTLPQLVNTKFSTANFMNENDEIKEHRYCRVAWEEEKIPITTRNLEMTQLYGTQFGFNSLFIP